MDGLLSLTLTLHNLWRWVVVLAAVVAVVKFAIGWLSNRAFGDTDSKILAAYVWSMTIQFVLGIVLLLFYLLNGAFNPAKQIEHAVYGLIAVALAHMTAMFKNKPDQVRFRNSLLLILASLLVVLFSVWRLRGSMFYGLF